MADLNETKSSLGLVDHFKDYADTVLNRIKPSPGVLVVDLGSNDGTLLRFFKKHGMTVLGVDSQESDALIAELAQRTGSTDGDYRHKWQAGDVVLWDNRCSIHCATGDYPVNERRVNWRTTIMERGWKTQQARTA